MIIPGNPSVYYFVEFIQGQRDCKSGIPHKDGSESYNAGYSAQYHVEQYQDNQTLTNNHRGQS